MARHQLPLLSAKKRSPRSTPDADLKIRQLQQYLHRPGQIPTAPHPFVKQAVRKADRQRSQPQFPPSFGQRLAHWRDRLLLGGGVVYGAIVISIPTAIASLVRCTVRLPMQRSTSTSPRRFDADDRAAIAGKLPSNPHHKS